MGTRCLHSCSRKLTSTLEIILGSSLSAPVWRAYTPHLSLMFWVAQLFESLSLGFSYGRGLGVLGSSSTLGSALGEESVCPSLSATPLALSFSYSTRDVR